MGIRFLKHIERTRVLLFLIDALDPQPAQTISIIERELREFSPDLLKRSHLVVMSKGDLVGHKRRSTFPMDLRISSVTGEGLQELLNRLWALLQTAPR